MPRPVLPVPRWLWPPWWHDLTERFDAIDERLDAINTKTDVVLGCINTLSGAIVTLRGGLANVLTSIDERMEDLMTDQEHLDADVAAIRKSFTDGIAELKAQIAAGVPAQALNFATLDQLAADEAAETAADAPPVVTPVPTPPPVA